MIERAKENSKELSQVHIVGCLVEAKATTIVQIHGELGREAFTEHLHRRRHLFLADLLVLLFLVGRLQSLPREIATIEVHQHITQRLHIIATTLLDS